MMRRTPALVFCTAALCLDPAAADAATLDGATLSWPWALPFIGILLTIALGPLAFARFWHDHYGKLAFAWAALTLAPLAAWRGPDAALAALAHAMLGDYLGFITILFALYVVAGGIMVAGTLRGTPLVNSGLLAFGTLIASVIGTTGAAMILIRPLMRANAARLAQCPCRGIFHLPGRQYRRRAVAARRSAAVHRLPQRRRFFLAGADICGSRPRSPPAACWRCSWSSTCGSIARIAASRRSARRAGARRSRVHGLVNLPLLALIIAAVDCLRAVEAGHQLHDLRHAARAAEPRARRGADR